MEAEMSREGSHLQSSVLKNVLLAQLDEPAEISQRGNAGMQEVACQRVDHNINPFA